MSVPQLMNAYARGDTLFVKGRGTRLWDADGKEYLDALAGIAVCGLGHAHPTVTQALCQQAETLTHSSNIFHNQPQQTLAQNLCALAGMDNVFFSNSGAEANEAAIKIARKYGHQQGVDKPAIIVMQQSFHGRTLATLSATGNPKVQEGFEPLVEGFIRVPFDDVAAVQAATEQHDNIVAVLVEPVQGEGGIRIPAADYLDQLRALCDQHNWLLMLDEIQTGMGRTGKFMAYQHSASKPDVITLAKALGNGFPIGACLARGKAAEVIQPGNHGTTFGGNPLACHTAQAVLNVMQEEKLVARAAELGQQLLERLQAELGDLPQVTEVRGHGLMLGIELDKPCSELFQRALEAGLVINVTAGNVVRLLPPLIFSDADADLLVEKLSTLIRDFS